MDAYFSKYKDEQKERRERIEKNRTEITASIPTLLLVTGAVQSKVKADVCSCVAEREANGTWYLEPF
jgi:hypothetical protein